MTNSDSFSDFDRLLDERQLDSPWENRGGGRPLYVPDHEVLEQLLEIPVRNKEVSETGRFPKAIDSWAARELRRAGFGEDEVWPRTTRPRVLPRDISVLLEKLPKKLASDVRDRVADIPAVAPVEARILGRAYEKQVDVCIARWQRGPELIVSTKAMLSSFGNNLKSRFEEAYGDAANLRGRFPLASIGFLFVQRATILTKERGAFEKTVDMMRKLKDLGDGNGYTATGLVLVNWTDPPNEGTRVSVESSEVPPDVAAPQFFLALIEQVLSATPVEHHVNVRERFEGRSLPVDE